MYYVIHNLHLRAPQDSSSHPRTTHLVESMCVYIEGEEECATPRPASAPPLTPSPASVRIPPPEGWV